MTKQSELTTELVSQWCKHVSNMNNEGTSKTYQLAQLAANWGRLQERNLWVKAINNRNQKIRSN